MNHGGPGEGAQSSSEVSPQAPTDRQILEAVARAISEASHFDAVVGEGDPPTVVLMGPEPGGQFKVDPDDDAALDAWWYSNDSEVAEIEYRDGLLHAAGLTPRPVEEAAELADTVFYKMQLDGEY